MSKWIARALAFAAAAAPGTALAHHGGPADMAVGFAAGAAAAGAVLWLAIMLRRRRARS